VAEVETTSAPERPALTPALTVAAAASAAAGLVHAAAAGGHEGDQTLVVLFGATAVAQVGWAAWAALRRSQLVLVAGMLLNAAAAGAWVVSRTVGLPVIDSLAAIEPVGRQDFLAAALGAVAAIGALWALVRWDSPPARATRLPQVLGSGAALVLAFAAVTAGHNHGPSHDHAHSEEEAAAADHGHGDGEAHEEGDVLAASGPIISLDDPRVTPEQRAAAQELIDTTRAAMAPLADQAAIEAAGYSSIGDGVTGFEHFVNFGYLIDGVTLEPARVESIVMQVNPDGTKQVVSGMYILPPGQTMDDVPDIAGELTTWHDHDDLCWEGGRVVGLFRDGACRPAGTLMQTPPMMHVWVVDNPCGPFAGLEGHGEDCGHGH
jgi:hypothetical protein